MRISGRFVESFGRLVVAESLLKAGFECAEPIQDDGIDLVAFSGNSGRFVTIQLKASTKSRFSIHEKYKGHADIVAFAFKCKSSAPEVYALSYSDLHAIAKRMCYIDSPSWLRAKAGKRSYSIEVGKELSKLLEPYRADQKRWKQLLGARV